MFARLKSHAETIEVEIQTLEKSLETKTKSIFSIVNSEVSDGSIQYMRKLITELEDMAKTTGKMVSEAQLINSNCKNEYDHSKEDVRTMSDQLNKMEDHLVDFGFVKKDNFRKKINCEESFGLDITDNNTSSLSQENY